MKLNFFKKIIFGFSALAIIFLPFNLVPAAAATSSNVNCNSMSTTALKNQCLASQSAAAAAAANAAAAAAQAAQVQAQVNTINDSISKINAEIATTAGQISDTQKSIDNLNTQIATEENNLAQEKAKMDQLVAAWYMQGQSGLLDTILSSDNVSAVVDQQQQYDAVKEQITSSEDKIQTDENNLNAQKDTQTAKEQQLNDLQTQQKSSRVAAVAESNQENNLLTMTKAQQQDYLNQAAAAKKEIEQVSAQDAALRAAQDARSNAKITTGGSGGYPYGNPDGLDPWGFYQEQCTSYAAWYWNEVLGKSWTDTQPGNGDARNWDQIAATLGYSTGSTPEVGAIISWKDIGSHGHVAIVQKVNDDGSIDVSEYNWIAYSYDYRAGVQPGIYGRYVYIYP